MLTIPFATTGIIYIIIISYHFLRTGSIKIRHFPFSIKNYYLMLSGFVINILILSFAQHSFNPLLAFFVFAVAGVLGETLLSFWWQYFFGRRFWEYEVDTLFHAYSSLLNFIPYGIGGFFFMRITDSILIKTHGEIYAHSLTVLLWGSFLFFATLTIQIMSFFILFQRKNSSYKFHHMTVFSYLFFISPTAIALAFMLVKGGAPFVALSFAFGILGTSVEYLFGKATQFFISKKMWTYNYVTFDNGHFTPLAILPFVLTGYYFMILTYILRNFIAI